MANKTIFISYSHGDRELTEMVATFLYRKRYEPWFDREVNSGAEHGEIIKDKIDEAIAAIVIRTSKSIASKAL